MAVTPEDFGASFQGFMKQMAREAPTEEPVFLQRLRAHFEQDPALLPIVSETFAQHEHPSIQLALDRLLSEDGVASEALGVVGEHPYMGIDLASLAAPSGGGMMGFSAPRVGPMAHVNIPLESGRVLTCVNRGLLLMRDGDVPLAMLVQGPLEQQHYFKIKLEVMARRREHAEALLAGFRTAIRESNVYRGHVLSLDSDCYGNIKVAFHNLPEIRREDVILPEGTLERIERQTISFTKHRDKLLASGRHLKRGLLLFGPPGTGKTLTAMYLAGAIHDRTIILLTGTGLGLLASSCSMARTLEPSIVVLEDVDLIAEERTHRDEPSPLLFELLNQMDGLADDADVLFLLTTNRPDLLEPALAARPGRIDQAIEIPLPDEACRRRLFDLYGQGLTLELDDISGAVRQTEGASAAFIRELMRRAALFAADEGESIVVRGKHLDEALHELVVQGGEMTMSLLGFRSPDADSGDGRADD